MADVVLGSLLKIAVECFLHRVQDEAAKSLQNGDITELHFREMIVRELNDIKSMLRGIVRQDLIASIAFFNDGIEVLYYHLNQSKHEAETASRKEEKKRGNSEKRNGEQLTRVVEQHIQSYSDENRERNSSKAIKAAKENFKQASQSATRAISNQGMSDEDRFLAYKVKIAAVLIENFDEPEIAIPLCKKTLAELNSMALVTHSCKVHFGKSFMKLFYFNERESILRSIASVHRAAWHYIHACAVNKQLPAKFDIVNWPLLKVDGRLLHPILHQEFASFNYWHFGRCGVLEARLNYPTDITINSLGQFIVSDTNNSRVVVWSATGTFVEGMTLVDYDDDDDLASIRPRGVAVDSQDTIYVCDSVMNRIHVLEKGATFTTRVIARPDTFHDRMSNFSGVHVDKRDRLLVSDVGMKCVHEFSRDGEYLGNFGNEELGCPTEVSSVFISDIASTAEGNIFVTDPRHNCIRVYDIDKKLVQNISVVGRAFRPVGVVCNPFTGEILVSDHHSKHIFTFSESGKYIRDVGYDNVTSVAGLEVTREGHVMLVDDKESLVHVF